MPVNSIRFQGGINRYRNAEADQPFNLKNSRIEPFGVVVGLRAPTNFYPFWEVENYTLNRGTLASNRAPYFHWDGNSAVSVWKIAAGSSVNRAPYWRMTTANIDVIKIPAGSITTFDPVFNIDEGETITIELT